MNADKKAPSETKMMPGQTPYTLEEAQKLDQMLRDAMDAEDEFDLDELERHADSVRGKQPSEED